MTGCWTPSRVSSARTIRRSFCNRRNRDLTSGQARVTRLRRLRRKKGRLLLASITFEEIMFTIMSATQDTFKSYMGTDIYAGKVEKKINPMRSDVVGIVGVAG